MANCVIEPSLSSVYRALVKKVGNVEAIALTMYFNIHNNGTYDPKFLDWYKATTGKDFLDSVVTENESTEESNKSNIKIILLFLNILLEMKMKIYLLNMDILN